MLSGNIRSKGPHEVHMEEGPIGRTLLLFAVPILISQLLQELYGIADTLVVGRFIGGAALAATGIGHMPMSVIINFLIGFSSGLSVITSHLFGAREYDRLRRTIRTVNLLGCLIGLAIMVIGPLITGPLLKAVGTLPSMYDGCRAYLNIFFYGIAGFFFYNIFAGILRGLGDSFSALLYLIITAALNIVLDLAFVNSMGVAGVALATVIAQLISAFLCLRKILSLKSVFRLHRSDLRPLRSQISRIVGLGIPSGLTQAIFSCAMMVVQRLINGFDDEMFVACNVMVMRVDGYAMLPNFSFGQAMGTFAGQNIGARRLDRLKDGTRQGLIMSVCTALVLTPAVLLSGPALMRLFTPEQALIDLSMQMMYILAAGYIAMSVTQVLQGVMRGAGDTVTPMWIGLCTAVILRLPLAYALVNWARNAGMSLLMQERMVFISLLINWLIGMIVTIVLYKIGRWKRKIPDYGES